MTEANQRRVIYMDSNGFPYWASWTPLLESVAAQGYNTVILAFYLGDGPTDAAVTWTTVANGLNSNPVVAGTFSTTVPPGMKLLVSAGGANFNMSSVDPTVFGTAVGTWAAQNNLDGIDFDIENLLSGATANDPWPSYIDWLTKSTTAAYNSYLSTANKAPIITHAPQGPYFGPVGGNLWAGSTGGYTAVEKAVGKYINWYNIQFYNQGGTCYSTTTGLTTNSASDCPVFAGTSINEIVSYGIPANKIVVGKPLASYGFNGFISNLAGALDGVSYGGIMGWQWDGTPATSCATLLGQPCPNSSGPPTFSCTTCPPYQCNSASTACSNPCSTDPDCVSGYTCSSGVCNKNPAPPSFNCNTCPPYQCNSASTACSNPCSTDPDCVPGYTCASGVCTKKSAPSGFDCTTCPPYQCNSASTACSNPCGTDPDCVSGYTCASGVCTKKSAPSGPSGSSSSSTWIILFVLIVVLALFGFFIYGRKKSNPPNTSNQTDVNTEL